MKSTTKFDRVMPGVLLPAEDGDTVNSKLITTGSVIVLRRRVQGANEWEEVEILQAGTTFVIHHGPRSDYCHFCTDHYTDTTATISVNEDI